MGKRTRRRTGKRYRVVGRTSTRASVDRASEDFERWVNFEVGELVTEWPAHAPVAEWIESGHWVEEAD